MSDQTIAFILGMIPVIGLGAAYAWWGLFKPRDEDDRNGQ